MSLNSTLSDMFKTMAAVLEIRGEPVFKAIAFTRVARAIDDSTVDLRKAVEQGTLAQIQGVGKSSAKVIEEFVKTGKSTDFEELIQTIPTTLIQMLAIPGLGPKTISKLWKERDVKSVAELSKAIDEGKLEGVAGLGAKKIEQIKQGISLRETAGKRVGLPDALNAAETIVAQVRTLSGVEVAEFAGSVRRRKETIGDVDIIAVVSEKTDPSSVAAAFTKLPGVSRVLGQGPSKSSIVNEEGLQIDLRIVPRESFGSAMMYFTGSKEHNVRLRGMAQDRGMTLNEWGLYKLDEYEKAKKEVAKPPELKAIASRTEADVYRALDLKYIEPELREDRGEIDLAAKDTLPKLIEQKDIRGELHCHTTASDGTASIEQMAQRAMELGYDYMVITDHSKGQAQARGLDAKRLLKQVEDLRKIAAKLKGFTLMIGSECDILADGRMDFEDEVLKELDFVVGSPHQALRQEVDKATDRILKAIDNPYVNVIGHPTGRLISLRPGLDYEWQKVFEAAKKSGTAMEINSGWPRLDLNDVHARAALEAGVMLTIDTDAHSTEELGANDLGICVARRAGVTAKHVLNAKKIDAVKKWVSAKRL